MDSKALFVPDPKRTLVGGLNSEEGQFPGAVVDAMKGQIATFLIGDDQRVLSEQTEIARNPPVCALVPQESPAP
jgi:hypothetical protein